MLLVVTSWRIIVIKKTKKKKLLMEGITMWVKILVAYNGVGEIFFSQAYNRPQYLVRFLDSSEGAKFQITLVKRMTNSSLVVFLMDDIDLELGNCTEGIKLVLHAILKLQPG